MTEVEAVPPEQEVVEAEGEGQPIEDGAELADEEPEQDEGESEVQDAEEPGAPLEEMVVEQPREATPPEPFVPGPLVISEQHENFSLDKKMEDDPSIGYPNPRHIICQFCEVILIPDGNAVKVAKEINLIQNTQREYDLCSTYWHCSSLLKF